MFLIFFILFLWGQNLPWVSGLYWAHCPFSGDMWLSNNGMINTGMNNGKR